MRYVWAAVASLSAGALAASCGAGKGTGPSGTTGTTSTISTGGTGGTRTTTGTGGAGGGPGDGGPTDGGPGDGGPTDGGDGGVVVGASVLQHHNHANRDGVYVDPALTKAAVAGMKADTAFAPTITGNQYAQPLYVENGPGGKGAFYVVTETNDVYALDEATGAEVWTQNMGTPAAATGCGPNCGNIFPLGITGTPAIDLVRRRIYLDAVLATGPGGTIKTHLVHALSIDDGSEAPGWPVDTASLTFGTSAFDPVSQNQRGALVIAGDRLYVPYGGHLGDCPHNGVYYHGWVIGIPLDDPAGVKTWATDGIRGGIWGSPGLASDGTDIFAASANGGVGNEEAGAPYHHTASMLRFQPGPAFSGQTTDFFAPSNWIALDNGDLDFSGSGVLLVDVPGAAPSQLVVSLGKNGMVYVADRSNLGGIGADAGMPPVASSLVDFAAIIGAPAWYATASGVYVVFVNSYGLQGGAGCPAGQSGDLVALRIGAASPPTVEVAWCQNSNGQGSPSVTVAGADTLVWTAGALGTGHLHAFDGDTGTPVYTSAETLGSMEHWVVPIAVHGRVLVGGNGALYAFKP